jgi:Fic family protein
MESIGHSDVLELHRILLQGVMDQGEAGCYRTIGVRVGRYVPPAPAEVSGLMFELLEWWNTASGGLSPVLSSAILHYRFEAIHPFADGNGRLGRALALWELYRRGFDTHHIFSVDEYYREDRPRYYAALEAAREEGDDLTGWLEYCAEGLRHTLERVWVRLQAFDLNPPSKLVLRPKQERLLQLLSDHGGMAPAEIWAALDISRQGAMDLLRPLLDAGLVEKIGGKKTGRYVLCRP